jgi:succinate-semialdehyde dehydrogenase/glutarate-semialdehyde dehydrogenase
VVLKPAEQTPLSALALTWLAEQAGLPAGVLNVMTSSAKRSIEVGQAWCESPIVRHLSFTGSTEVGRILMRQCGATIKKMALELGGNAPFIVFEDADLDAAVEGAMAAKFRNAGQTCVCVNRFYVHSSICDAFVERLAARTSAMRVGNGFHLDTVIGPLIDDAAVAKVQSHIADALQKGARTMCGDQAPDGRFIQPTVLADVTDDMLCMQEETFGPLASVARFETEAEVVSRANSTEFGLASYVYTRDISRAFRVSEALECGMVGVNTGQISAAEAPFGGIKQSGLGREGARQGIDEYLETKYICLGGLQGA